jgi:Tfp pilus assembly PilM family ATPase
MNLRSLTRQPVLTLAVHRRAARWTIGAEGRVSCAGSAPLPPQFVDDGVVRDPEAVARILENSDFSGSGRMRAVLALPAQRSVFRQLDVPPLKGKPFDEMVEREIRREMPMLGDNAYVSWTRAGMHGGAATVFVVGVARDVLDSHIATARAARLHVVAADLRIIAAARAVGQSDAVIANIEDDEAEIGIFIGGVPAIIRYVAMASQPDEAAWAEQLAEELARTLKFYRDSHRDDEIVAALPITFVGGAARQAMFASQVPAATGHEVAMPPLGIALKQEQETVVFAANVGLALKDLAA